jgi:hypothetical protein
VGGAHTYGNSGVVVSHHTDIIATTHRLHAIGISQTDTCRLCTASDTLIHRLVECGNGPDQWAWMRGRMAAILRKDTNCIPDSWLIRPRLTLWSPRRRRAILWMLAHYAVFRVTLSGDRTNTEFLTYLRRAITTIYQHPKRLSLVENCFIILHGTSDNDPQTMCIPSDRPTLVPLYIDTSCVFFSLYTLCNTT